MQINITARDFGGTEFLAQPHRLHLGAQKAEGVDRLEFSLPEQWKDSQAETEESTPPDMPTITFFAVSDIGSLTTLNFKAAYSITQPFR